MIDLEALDETMKLRCAGAHWLLRIGSSIHEDWFREESDVDYLLVLDDVSRQFIDEFPGRTSPSLPAKVSEHNSNFYWRLEAGTIDRHRISVTIYSTLKFLEYCNARSPPKVYILHEHLLLLGSAEELETLRLACPPNRDTAIQDLQTLQNPRYEAIWPWGWRSVSIAQGGAWLKNKAAIEAYVEKNYPGRLHDKAFLIKTLTRLINEDIYKEAESR